MHESFSPTAPRTGQRLGFIMGLLAVASFSLTLPATRIAVRELDPTTVGLGRALVAAVVAGAVLLLAKERLPSRDQLRRLALTASGVVLGFPLLSAWAMQHVPASHGAVLLAIYPLATAGAARWRLGERPSRWFWIATSVGTTTITTFAICTGGGSATPADLVLLAAMGIGAIGYAEGGRLAREMGGWRVISWALVMAAPVAAIPVVVSVAQHGLDASPESWLAFAYVAIISQYLGFFAWYYALAVGGVARMGQIQLLQPFFTIAAAAIIAGESLEPLALAAAAVVAIVVAIGRKEPGVRPPAQRKENDAPDSGPARRTKQLETEEQQEPA